MSEFETLTKVQKVHLPNCANTSAQISVIVTSNLPFSQWSTAFTDDQILTAALLDRLLHHAHIGQMADNSYRLKGKKAAGISPVITPVK